MKYILHIDTSGDVGLVALAADGEVLNQRTNTDTRNHAAVINIHINEVINVSGIKLNDLAAVAVCGGPGSYTGLRIGLATAKGLCYALGIPLLLHNKLIQLTVEQHYKFLSTYENYISILPARDKEYFISTHNSEMKSVVAPRHVFEDELVKMLDETDEKTLITGSLGEDILLNENVQLIENQSINIKTWAKYSFEGYNKQEFAELSSAEPFYLKDVYTHKSNRTA